MPRKLNLVGETYGRLLVIGEAEPHIQPSGHKATRWKCRCSCGNETLVLHTNLKSGNTVSCGCYHKVKSITHGQSKSKEYKTWADIKNRCNNSNDPYYKDYGGRGIKVCDKWLNSFEQFLSDVGEAPKGKLVSIDRISTNGNYEPGNVRWVVNQSIQNINRRIQSNNTSGHKGVSWDRRNNKWQAYISINKKLKSLGSFSTKEEAIAARKAAEEQHYKPLLKTTNSASVGAA